MRACSQQSPSGTIGHPPVDLSEYMRLSEFLRSDFVLAQLEARDVDGVIRELSAKAASAGVSPEDLIAHKLLERERAHPTVIGAGLAVPHATVPGLEEPVIGVALAPAPVVFGPPGTEPVRLFMVLLSPPGREREHVKILARICRLIRHADFLDQLGSAHDERAIIRVIEAIDARHA
ncbi:MAG TPA: PTS sugar transporter subunit IIA [Longimicrobiales bacterium]|nr:PTS sugar transporter subunit IIA [Longimicrobiales bacterium]